MNIFTVIGIIGISMTALVALISATMYSLSRAVTNTYAELDAEQNRYKPAITLGHKIAPEEDKTVQFQQARLEAAKKAAALPRGANMRIGRAGQSTLRTASANLKEDPVSSFKIALEQGWEGLGQFDQYQAVATGAQAATAGTTTVKRVRRKLVAGKDYDAIAITDAMDAAEKKRARIANAKAKSAAYKKLKESGEDMVVVEEQSAPAAAAAPASASAAAPAQDPAAAAAAAGIEPPTLIEITDGMDPADIRKARIANAKATSAYKKALKAAGIDPNAKAPAAAAAPVAAPAPVPVAAPAAAPAGNAAAAASGVEKPDLIEITDDMDPADIRKARIANAKAKSAYKKALKAAGIDPSTVEI